MQQCPPDARVTPTRGRVDRRTVLHLSAHAARGPGRGGSPRHRVSVPIQEIPLRDDSDWRSAMMPASPLLAPFLLCAVEVARCHHAGSVPWLLL